MTRLRQQDLADTTSVFAARADLATVGKPLPTVGGHCYVAG
jgi:hypothetical protein